jgi:hypothetical protein
LFFHGDATDQSQIRHSTRASSAVNQPNMVATALDSRIQLTKPANGPAAVAPSSESGQSNAPSRVNPKEKRIIEDNSLVAKATPSIVRKKKTTKKKRTKKAPTVQVSVKRLLSSCKF